MNHVEKTHSSRDSVRKAKESHLIDKAMTLEPHGLNRRDDVIHILIVFSFPVSCVVRHFRLSFLNNFCCDILHCIYTILVIPVTSSVTSVNLNKYCYEKTIHVVLISFAVFFGLGSFLLRNILADSISFLEIQPL